MGGGGREGVYTLLAHFLLLWKQLGREREGGEGGKERGSPRYGGERGEGMRYHIVGVFAYFAVKH